MYSITLTITIAKIKTHYFYNTTILTYYLLQIHHNSPQEQYTFIHDVVLESVTCGDTQIGAKDLKYVITRLRQRDQTTGRTQFDTQFEVCGVKYMWMPYMYAHYNFRFSIKSLLVLMSWRKDLKIIYWTILSVRHCMHDHDIFLYFCFIIQPMIMVKY